VTAHPGSVVHATLFPHRACHAFGGDEIGRTQQATTTRTVRTATEWFDWNLDEHRCQLLEFTRGLIAFRKAISTTAATLLRARFCRATSG
jgi:pullulanase/glycogen debranching enzyme